MKEKNKVYHLFEYAKPTEFTGGLDSFNDLDAFLDEIWKKREKSSFNFWNKDNYEKHSPQHFIEFFRKNLTFRSTKYVGIIRYNGQTINLLPKIFDSDNSKGYSDNSIESIQRHILWWLSYCGRFRFPKSKSSFKSVKTDFFEVLIYLYASYTKQILSNSIYQGYQEINNELPFMKGRLDVSNYITHNIVTGNHHKLSCVYDSFEMDNLFNRIIKYVSKLLLNHSQIQDNKKLLREIVFILDEVEDIKASLQDCLKVKLNPIFKEMFTVLDYCKLFLSNSTVLSYKNDFDIFAFLIPMEYIFEDFVFGFIKKEMPELKVKSQEGTTYLTTDGIFKLKPDLVFNIKDRKVIADTKYKCAYYDDNDKKKGILEADMYQMLAYAIRNKVTEIKLLFPST